MKLSISFYLITSLTFVLAVLFFRDQFRSDYTPMSVGSDIQFYLQFVALVLGIILLILQILKEYKDLKK